VDDVVLLRDLLAGVLLALTTSTMVVVLVATIMFLTDWRLTLLVFTVLPLIAVVSLLSGQRMRRAARRQRHKESEISVAAHEALPNFLEAQARAKISRVVADMRTIVLALESYNTDNGRYPEDYAADRPHDYGMDRLTSPVAYITEVPLDGFGGYYDEERGLQVRSFTLGAEPDQRPVRWAMASVGPDREDTTSPLFEYPGYSPHIWENPASGYIYIRYDATNGTMSAGDIIRVSDYQADW